MVMILTLLIVVSSGDGLAWEKRDVVDCENVFQISDTVYSGSEPGGAAAFEALAELGVTTIVTVDGARPDVDTAKRYGIRYIHLPIGYDGFSRERALQFGRVLEDAAGAVYFHCHHGKHRGPAAVAAGMEASGMWTPAKAEQFLHAAGTSEKYTGLYAAVQRFSPPSPDELTGVDTTFPAVVDLPPFQESMAHIDRHRDNLALALEAGWTVPPDHPDISPPHEALQLREIFTELIRLEGDAERPEAYRQWMEDARESAHLLETALSDGATQAADAAFTRLTQSCTACHNAYRN